MEKYNIRKIEENDFYKDYLSLLSELTKTSNCTYDEFINRIKQMESQNSFIYVIEDNNTIIATGKLLIEYKLHNNLSNMGHIEDVVVSKKYRGNNFGKLLIKKLIDKARELNCYKVVANCNEDNIIFYEKCNMKIKGTEMCIYL